MKRIWIGRTLYIYFLVVLNLFPVSLSWEARNRAGRGHSYKEKRIAEGELTLSSDPNLSTSEYDALYDLYNATNGRYWTWYNTSSNSIPWNFSNSSLNNPCADHWQGITCTCSALECNLATLTLPFHNLTGTIPSSIDAWFALTVLDLANNSLFGSLPETLENLYSLEFLSLSSNNITSSLPENIGNLTPLQVLTLDNNQFNGSLPISFYSLINIEIINLTTNFFHGNLSSSIINFQSLQQLDLATNTFEGTLPKEIFQLPNLQYLDLGINFFIGSIPHTIGQAKSLIHLNLQSNGLNGYLPSSLTNLTENLRDLFLTDNVLSGRLPHDIGKMKPLTFFEIQSNQFNGTIPESIYNLTNLILFSIEGNYFDGTISENIKKLQNITALSIGFNLFHGPFPNVLNYFPNLQIFSLKYNSFTGPFPSTFITAKNLTTLSVVRNYFKSSIPKEIGTLKKLKVFDFADNYLTGTLPKEIGNLSSIENFLVIENQLYGSIPAEIFSSVTSTIRYFGVGNNSFTGTFPKEITVWNHLKYIDLSRNSFHGNLTNVNFATMKDFNAIEINNNFFTGDITNLLNGTNSKLIQINCISNLFSRHIPNVNWSEYIEFYEISDNYFTGTIPSYFGNLPDLFHFEVAQNYLKGTAPEWIGQTKLRYFNASYNLLTGRVRIDIPQFSPVIQLKEFSLQNNFLTGPIPREIGEISNIVDLTLNNNEFTGSIPDSFVHLINIEVLFLQNNKLTGSLPDFNNIYTMTNCDFTNNRLTGTLPSTYFFNFPLLSSFAASTNCFHGSIPSEICNINNLQVLELDGLSAAENCRLPIFPGSEILTSFTLKTTIDDGIPFCLFNMHKLQTLHLSGNGLTGSFPKELNISNSLRDLTLSHNLLTGTIPNYIQNRVWGTLDLSYNKLTGTLSSNIPSYKNDSSLTLELNRLSGPISGSLLNADNINILEGNMFSCNIGKTDLPKHDSKAADYSCGSDVVNTTLYSWVAIVGILVLFLIIYRTCFFENSNSSPDKQQRNQEALESNLLPSNKMSPNLLDYLKETVQWRQYYLSYNDNQDEKDSNTNNPSMMKALMKNMKLNKVPRLLYLRDLFYNTRHVALIILLFTFLILLPFYVSLSSVYNAYYHSYAWNVSAVLLTGERPGLYLAILAILFILFVVFCYEIFIIHGMKISLTILKMIPSSSSSDSASASSSSSILDQEQKNEMMNPVHSLSGNQSFSYHDHSNKNNDVSRQTLPSPNSSFMHSIAHKSRRASWFIDPRRTSIKIEYLQNRHAIQFETKERYSGNIYYFFDILALFLIAFCNLGIMMSADIAYVYVFLNYPTVVIVFSEVILALFKISLNNSLLWISIPIMKRWLRFFWGKHDPRYSEYSHRKSGSGSILSDQNNDPYLIANYFYTTRDVLFITISILLNNIVFPALAIFIVSSDCFYNGLFPPSDVESSYSYTICNIYTPGDKQICLSRRRETETTSYQPPFIYNYQCASSIIINYAPVFIIMYTFEGVLNILFKLLLKYYHDYFQQKVKKDHEILQQNNPNHSNTNEWRTWNEFFYEKVKAILPNYWRDFTSSSAGPDFVVGERQSYFIDKNRISVRISSYFVVMVSFGALFPPLAFILCVTIITVILHEEIVIGRLLYESDSRGIPWIKKQLERDCYGIADALQHSLWYLVPVSSVAFAYVIFDTWGDQTGAWPAFPPTVIVFVIPILIVVLLEIYHQRSTWFKKRRQKSTASVGVEFQDAERFSSARETSQHSQYRDTDAFEYQNQLLSSFNAGPPPSSSDNPNQPVIMAKPNEFWSLQQEKKDKPSSVAKFNEFLRNQEGNKSPSSSKRKKILKDLQKLPEEGERNISTIENPIKASKE